MDLLERYEELLEERKKLLEERENLNASKKEVVRELDELTISSSRILRDKNQEYSQIESELRSEEVLKFKYIKDEIEKLRSQIDNVRRMQENRCSSVDDSEFVKKNKKKYKLLEELEIARDSVVEFLADSVEEEEIAFREAIEELNILSDCTFEDEIPVPLLNDMDSLTYIESKSNMTDKVLEYNKELRKKLLSFNDNSRFSVKEKFISYGALLGLLVLLFVNVSYAFLGLLVIEGGFIIKAVKDVEETNIIRQRLNRFVNCYDSLQRKLVTASEEFQQEEINKIKQSSQEAIDVINGNIVVKQREYDQCVNSINMNTPEMERKITEKIETRYSEKFKRLEEERSRLTYEQEKLSEDSVILINKLNDIGIEIENYKCSIHDKYWALSEIGSNKLLTNRLIIGMSGDEIMSFELSQQSTFIVYDGGDSKLNSILINMMIAQFYADTCPNKLNIVIFDLKYTCRDYAMYSKCEQLFTFIAENDAASNEIQFLYKELIYRKNQICTVADNIEEFNKSMMESGSLTLGYVIIIFQNATENILESNSFKQLCITGPMFGMIPIVFIQRDLYNRIISETDDNGQLIHKELIDMFDGTLWAYNQKTLEFERKVEL